MMAIFRVNKTTDYTVMSNYHFRNKELSLKAKGLLSLMLSLPDGWEFTEEGLTTLCSDGIKAVKSALHELVEAGHIVRSRERKADGTLAGMTYDVYEKPLTKATSPTCQKPTLEKPMLEKPTLDNGMQLNTNKSNTKELNTKSTITRARTIPPTHEEVSAFFREIGGSDAMAEEYMDHYQANGWKVGKTPMKDWKAAVRNWKRRDWRNKGQPEERDYQEDFHAKVNDPVRDMLEAMK